MPKNVLVRYALASGNRVVRDDGNIMPGRGAYVCNDPACLERAIKKGAFSRAFRVKADHSGLVEPDNG
ncbi:MAG: YlxR family protein [Lachnospiraceae bacterium]|nr:YlxR family protein [Lachnospiraceae bacterium]